MNTKTTVVTSNMDNPSPISSKKEDTWTAEACGDNTQSKEKTTT
jgi:hypothetical protein